MQAIGTKVTIPISYRVYATLLALAHFLRGNMLSRSQVKEVIDAGSGILRLEPCWVPRSFMIPGRRLKLHPDDLYAFGGHRGGINERWFSSTTKASNGPTPCPMKGSATYGPRRAENFC